MEKLITLVVIFWVISRVYKKLREGTSGDSQGSEPGLSFEQRIEQALERAKQAQEGSQGTPRPMPPSARPAPPPVVRPTGRSARTTAPPAPSRRSIERPAARPPVVRSAAPPPPVQARRTAAENHPERIPAPHSHQPHHHKPPLTTKPRKEIRSPRVIRALEKSRERTAEYQEAAKSTGISIVDPFAGAIGDEQPKKRRKRRLRAENLRNLVIFSEILNGPRGRTRRASAGASGGSRYPVR